MRRSYAATLVAAEERTLRGWSLLLIPEGAPRPPAADYRVLGRRQVATPDDPPILQGAVEVWIAPRGPLAKLLSALGLAP